MKKIKIGLTVFLVIVIATQVTACWNYREIDKLNIVTGLAIDQDADTGKYSITTEVIEIILSGKEKQIGTKLISSEGETLFDAARNLISVSGRRLYWSHAKVLIIGKELAQKGMIPALDFVHRDAEPRYDLDLIVSEGKASDIFLECHSNDSGILSYIITETLISQKSLSKAPMADEWQFISDMEDADKAAIVPMVRVVENGGKKVPEVMGTGIIQGEKLIGYLDGEETKTLLFILDKIKGGLIMVNGIYKNSNEKVALEIFDNKTKITPQISDDHITMKIQLQTEVTIGENTGTTNFNKEDNLKKLKEEAEQEQEEKIQKLIKKVQAEYGSDIFSFGNILNAEAPDVWDLVKDDWDEVFMLVDVDVKAEISIRNTGFMSRPIKVGE